MKKKCAIVIAMCLVLLSMVACSNKTNENVDVLGTASKIEAPVNAAVKVIETKISKEATEEATFLNFTKTPSGMVLLPTALTDMNADKYLGFGDYVSTHEHDSDCYKVYRHSGKPTMQGTTYCDECKSTVPIHYVYCVHCRARYTYSCWHLGTSYWSSGACKVELTCDKPTGKTLVCTVPESYLNCGQDAPVTLVCNQSEHMHNPCTALKPVYHNPISYDAKTTSCYCGPVTVTSYYCERCGFDGYEFNCEHQGSMSGLCTKEVYIACGLEEHEHSSDCYISHNHSDNCYKTHTHDDTCFVISYE